MSSIAAVLFFILGFCGLRRKVLWRLRNRLIVTYVFIGVIPAVLLVAMAFITLYLFGRTVRRFRGDLGDQLAVAQPAGGERGGEQRTRGASRTRRQPTAESLAGLRKRDRPGKRRRVCAWHGISRSDSGRRIPVLRSRTPRFFNRRGECSRHRSRCANEVVFARGLRVSVGSENLTSSPASRWTRNWWVRLRRTWAKSRCAPDARDSPAEIGEPEAARIRPCPTEFHRQSDEQRNQNSSRTGAGGKPAGIADRTFTVGTLPPPADSMDREITFGTPLPVVDWKTGKA